MLSSPSLVIMTKWRLGIWPMKKYSHPRSLVSTNCQWKNGKKRYKDTFDFNMIPRVENLDDLINFGFRLANFTSSTVA